jgi:hypothetical protein
MRIAHFAACLTVLALLWLPQIAKSESPGKLLPSEAITLMVTDAMNNPTFSREDVYQAYLPRVITDDLNEEEQFYLGEVYFFALMPEEARDAYYPLRQGESLVARVAWQRLLQIRVRAFEMHERAATDMVNFRKTFAADPADREYLSRQVLNFGNYYARQGEHEKVVGVVEAELAALNYGGAYASFIHPATFIESYIATGRMQQAIKHLQSAHDGLTETLKVRVSSPPDDDYNYPLPADRYSFFFTPVNEKLGWQQQNDKFLQLIDNIGASLKMIEST